MHSLCHQYLNLLAAGHTEAAAVSVLDPGKARRQRRRWLAPLICACARRGAHARACVRIVQRPSSRTPSDPIFLLQTQGAMHLALPSTACSSRGRTTPPSRRTPPWFSDAARQLSRALSARPMSACAACCCCAADTTGNAPHRLTGVRMRHRRTKSAPPPAAAPAPASEDATMSGAPARRPGP